MNLGAHVSIQGGLHKAPENAAAMGCECFQIFTRSPRGGNAKDITAQIKRKFRKQCGAFAQKAWYIHTPYYVNLAAGGGRLRELTVRIIREELERGRTIGAKAVMTHLGSAKELDPAHGMENVIANVAAILDGYRGRTKLLVENAAGSVSILGRSFEEVATVVKAARGRCGVCFDTQHAFASGYDLRTREAVKSTLDEFEKIIGLEHLHLIHSNDSKTPWGGRVDRHQHIGEGEIGKAGFRALLRDKRLKTVDFILETKIEGTKKDLEVLKELRGYQGAE